MQLLLDIVTPARPRRLDYKHLPAPLTELGGSLLVLRGGYEFILKKRKQPGVELEDLDLHWKGSRATSLALGTLENVLRAKAAGSSKTNATSRIADDIESLWNAFNRYCTEATRKKPDVVKLHSLFEEIDWWVHEIETQQALL